MLSGSRHPTFGQGTREAVISLQKERGLVPTGVVDAQTASAIGQNGGCYHLHGRRHSRQPGSCWTG